MSDLTKLSIAQAREELLKKNISSTELTKAYIDEIEKSNKVLNAYVATTYDIALDMAKKSDEKLKLGDVGTLEGIPLGIKDVFATKNVHTQCCSHMLDGFKPEYESTVTTNLWQDGAVMLGKLNMDEFAMGSSNESSYYGPSVNPWRASDSERLLVSGGSSGGSSAAVAGFLCAGATASDTGGSIRQPAAFTATVGIKPTYGRCSRWGIFAFASSLDQAGSINRTVRDSAIMLRSMASYDPKDSTSYNMDVPNYEEALGLSLKGKKIGIPLEFRNSYMSEDVLKTWDSSIEILKNAGAEMVNVSLDYSKYALAVYYIIASAEASSNYARYDGVRYGLRAQSDNINDMYGKTRARGFGQEVQRRILTGALVLCDKYYNKYYIKAQKLRRLIKQDFDNAFANGVDAILTPTTPSTAFPIGEEVKDKNFVSMYENDLFTVNVNMAGLPGISIPAGLSQNNLPIGMQFIGKPFDEFTLFQLADVIEKNVGSFAPKRWW